MASMSLNPEASSQQHWTQVSVPSSSLPDGFQVVLLPWLTSSLTSCFFTDSPAGPAPSPRCLWFGLDSLPTGTTHVLSLGLTSSDASHETTPLFVSPTPSFTLLNSRLIATCFLGSSTGMSEGHLKLSISETTPDLLRLSQPSHYGGHGSVLPMARVPRA